jgi:SAM-dependent methyltransferase
VAYNRELWNLYSHSWDDPRFRSEQLDPRLPSSTDPGAFRVLGEEWANAADVDRVVEEFIYPFISPDSVAAEIGVGGGRIAVRVAPKIARLVCLDISPQMLERARTALSAHANVELILQDGPGLPRKLSGRLDFIYSFDVFLHLDLHTMWKYVQEMSLALRPGGRALLHTTNLTAPDGWQMFAEQDAYSVEYGWFVSPEIVRTLVAHTDLILVKESQPAPSNLYFNRDYLAVLQKPG